MAVNLNFNNNNNKKETMKVLNNKCFKMNMLRVNLYNVVILLLCILCSVKLSLGVDPHKECSAVKLGFNSRGFNASDLLSHPINGRHLRVCVADKTCCSDATETRLAAHSRLQFDKTVKYELSKLSSVLSARAQRFDEFFRGMLVNSKKEFHEMFKKTYGIIYVQNSYVFTDLFEELEKYYNKGNVDLTEVMEHFFSVLYQRMFVVLNGQYTFDDKYLSCVSDHMKELKPFGDVPHKLSIQLKRSFVATRTFAKAIAVGADVVKHMLTIYPTQECSKSILRMHHCAGCAGHPLVKACSNYCINVMKGCLPYHASLENDWNNYVDAMDRISERLLGSFNIEMVVGPINLKISEAIMNFQENGEDVSNRVFQGCGRPMLGRKRRSVSLKDVLDKSVAKQKQTSSDDLQFEDTEDAKGDSSRNARATNREISYESYKFKNDAGGNERGGKGNKNSKQQVSSLEKLIRDIRHAVKESKRIWSHLPYQICNSEELADSPSNNDNCWNGTAIARYKHAVVGDGLSNQKHNPDVFVDINRQNSILNEQIYDLKSIYQKLQNAYQGFDVNWNDDEESFSTYASGFGSGDDTDDTEPDTPDDHEHDRDHEEGSGDSRNTHTFDPDMDNKLPVYPIPAHDIPIIPNKPTIKIPNITSNEIPDATYSSGANKKEMSLGRALFTYLFPIVMLWFGGMFADLL